MYRLNPLKKGLVAVLSLLVAFSSSAQSTGNAYLKGKLIGYGPTATLEIFDERQYLLPKSAHQSIQIGSDSTFEIAIPLDKPGYFRLGRTKLYLSPGDNLDAVMELATSTTASFTGKGSEANNYLKNTPFPKGGSFLESGLQIKSTPEETIAYIAGEAKKRESMLRNLKNVSKEFKRLETARIRADYIKSLMAMGSYGRLKFYQQGKEVADEFAAKSEKLAQPLIDSLKKDFIDASLLQVEVYRDIADKLDLDNPRYAKQAAEIRDWFDAYELASRKIGPENNKTILPGFTKDIASIATPRYRASLETLLADKMRFGDGDPAIDFTVRTDDGKLTKLSSLSGKIVYIDIWATWCGPCLAEMPYLETLKKDYASKSDVAIVSLSIDNGDEVWLRNLEKRKPGGIQWRIDRPDLADYNLVTVPRYILIGKDFRVVAMDAPPASDPKIRSLIDKELAPL